MQNHIDILKPGGRLVGKVLVLLLSTSLAWSCTSSEKQRVSNAIVVAPLSSSASAEGLVTESKLDAAIQFLTPHIPSNFVPMQIRDSVAQSIREDGGSASIQVVAQELNASKVAFFTVDNIENLLRVDVRIVNAHDQSEVSGRGFGMLRYKDSKTGAFVADPTILQAVANSLASVPDSSISNGARSQPVIVCGGFRFTATGQGEQRDWFKNKIVNSYSAVVDVTKGMAELGKLVVVDVDTRDSMLAKQGYYMLENYSGASRAEIQELQQYGVEYYMSGEVHATSEGLEVVAILYNIVEQPREIAREMMNVESYEWEKVQSALVHLTQRICKDENTWK